MVKGMVPGTACGAPGTQAELSSNLCLVTLLKSLGISRPWFPVY